MIFDSLIISVFRTKIFFSTFSVTVSDSNSSILRSRFAFFYLSNSSSSSHKLNFAWVCSNSSCFYVSNSLRRSTSSANRVALFTMSRWLNSNCLYSVRVTSNRVHLFFYSSTSFSYSKIILFNLSISATSMLFLWRASLNSCSN